MRSSVAIAGWMRCVLVGVCGCCMCRYYDLHVDGAFLGPFTYDQVCAIQRRHQTTKPLRPLLQTPACYVHSRPLASTANARLLCGAPLAGTCAVLNRAQPTILTAHMRHLAVWCTILLPGTAAAPRTERHRRERGLAELPRTEAELKGHQPAAGQAVCLPAGVRV